MFKNTRKVQNKPKRESKDVKASEYHELRGQVNKLRKQNAKLKRELERRANYIVDDEDVPSLAETEVVEPKTNSSDGCPQCGSTNLTNIDLGAIILMVCKDCKYRKKKEQ